MVQCPAVMPRYYFHVRDDISAQDEEGLELPDLAAARETALEAARDMCCADIKQGWLDLDCRIDVTDEKGETLLSITFGQAFEVRGGRR